MCNASLDWKNISVDEIYKRVVSKVKNSSIVLFHNAALNTPEALPRIMETLKKEEYEFVTVEEMIYKSNYTIDHTGMQILNEASITETTKNKLYRSLFKKSKGSLSIVWVTRK